MSDKGEALRWAREQHHRELEHRNELSARLGLPVGVLTLLAGLFGFLASGFPGSSGPLLCVFLFLLGGAVAAWLWCAVLLARTLHGHWYEVLPMPDKVLEYYKGVLEHHAGESNVEDVADAHLRGLLIERYVEAATSNADRNTKRSATLYRANAGMLVSLWLALAAVVPYVVATRDSKAPPLRVVVEGSVTVKSEAEQSMADGNDTPKKSEKKEMKQQPPPMPPEPKNRRILEGGEELPADTKKLVEDK